MAIKDIKKELSKQGKRIFDKFMKGGYRIEFDENNRKVHGELNIKNGINKIYDHQGLYGFLVKKGSKKALIYVGKVQKKSSDRMRQHLTGVNKMNDKSIKNTTQHKNQEIKDKIKEGFEVYAVTYSCKAFDDRPTLCAMEIALIMKAQKDFKGKYSDLEHWNKRIG